MSGHKYSAFLLEQERKAQQEALGEISRLDSEIGECQQQVRALLAAIPSGVAGAFPEDISQVQSWLHQQLPTVSANMTSAALKAVVATRKNSINSGQHCLHSLIDIKEVRRGARARELLTAVEQQKVGVRASASIVDRWFPGTSESLLQQLEICQTQIENDDLVETPPRLAQLTATLQQRHSEASALQQQDDQRRYVLQALRDVCREVGWDEEQEPVLEDSAQPGSAIVYKVDTYDAGIMTFRLSLKGIDVDSPIKTEGGACYREFSSFSERLKKFGVITKFESQQPPDELPEDRARGELDLPDEGMSQEMER